jgi:hypothetical protein
MYTQGKESYMSIRSSDYVLNATDRFIGTLWWGPDEYRWAMSLMLALTHVKDAFTSVPFALVTSDKPKVGKTTLSTDIPMLLADAPWEVNTLTTEPALRAKFMDRVPPKTICGPDISKLFGESGLNGRTSKVYQLLVAGYRRTGKVEVSVNRVSTQLPAYFVAFLDGLNNAVPGDLATRAIHFKLTAKPANISMRDALSIPVAREAEPLKKALHRWATSRQRDMQRFMLSGVLRVHPLLTDRLRQLWGPLFAIADAAGGEWPARCMAAFLEMALDENDKPVVLAEDRALLDTAKIIMKSGAVRVFTAELVPALRGLPGDDFYTEVDDGYLVGDLLPRALGPASVLRGRSMAGKPVTGEGWAAAPVLEAAAALYEELSPEPAETGPDAVQRALTLTEA